MPVSPRYHSVAITLHWVIAATLLVNLGLGVWMSSAIDSPAFQARAVEAFQLHKSLGLAVLVLSLLRLAWRLLYPPPPMPEGMAGWERGLAALTHWLFYGLMIGLPMSGWLYVSAQWRGDSPFNIPTLWFGLFEVPHLFGLSDSSRALRQQVATVAFNVHGAMALGLVVLLLMHIGAALKHHFLVRDGVLVRMLPWLATPRQPVMAGSLASPPRANVIAAGLVILTAVLLIGYASTTRLASPATGAASTSTEVLQGLVDDSAAGVAAWQIDAGSRIRFAGVHAGRNFVGHFEEWEAAIHFDPAALQDSHLAAVISTATATDGVPLHDRSLPQSEWFDVTTYPFATWRSTDITPTEDGQYRVEGILAIKGREVTLAPLTLALEGDQLNFSGTVELDRADVDMGMESDPAGQYVSRTIRIRVEVTASR